MKYLPVFIVDGRPHGVYDTAKTIRTKHPIVVRFIAALLAMDHYPEFILRGSPEGVLGFMQGMFPEHLYPGWEHQKVLTGLNDTELYLLWTLFALLNIRTYMYADLNGDPELHLKEDGQMMVQYMRGVPAREMHRLYGTLPEIVPSRQANVTARILRFEVTEVLTKRYTGPVYAFEVPWGTFTIPGAITHNSKINKGAFRLPGAPYEATHEVKINFPTGASKLGYFPEDLALDLAGYKEEMDDEMFDTLAGGTRIHRIVQRQLAEHNLLISAEKEVYDPYANVGSPIDAIIRGPNGAALMVEIKTAKEEKFRKILQEDRPQYKNVVQANWYLHELKHDRGIILYVNRDDPTQMKSFEINYSHKLYEKAMENLRKARTMAADIRQPGAGYSWVDRLKILSDIAPTSEEFQEAYTHVMHQARAGLLDQSDMLKVEMANQHKEAMLRRYELYPRRFDAENLFDPSSQYTQMSMNEHIKAAAEYSLPERMIGGLWEGFGNLRSPLHAKLLPIFDPMTQYERYVLYGEESSMWSDPYGDFIEPYYRELRSQTDPMSGLVAGSQLSLLATGRALSGISLATSAYGMVNGAYRSLTDTHYIPRSVEKRRDLWERYDELKYSRASYLYAATGNEQYKTEMDQTLYGMRSNNQFNISEAIHALPAEERPFLIPFMNMPEYQRDEIRDKVSPMLREILEAKWQEQSEENYVPGLSHRGGAQIMRRYMNPAYQGIGDDHGFRSPWQGLGTQTIDTTLSREEWRRPLDALSLTSPIRMPSPTWEGWAPEANMDDIFVKTVEESGYDAHDFGMGWRSQQRRMERHPVEGMGSIEYSRDLSSELEEVHQIRAIIRETVRAAGGSATISLVPTPGDDDRDVLEITLIYNRQEELRSALSAIETPRQPMWN